MEKLELLPPLTKEQVKDLIKFIKLNYDDTDMDMDYCCAEDGVTDGFQMAVEVIEKGYAAREQA